MAASWISRRPPLGVALLGSLYLLIAVGLLHSLIPEPPVPTPDPMPAGYFCLDCGGHDPWQFKAAWYVLLVGVVMLISAVGLLVGYRQARLVLIMAVVAWIGYGVFYETYLYITRIVAVEKPDELSSTAFWCKMLDGMLLWTLWLGLNCWYLFSRRTAKHFGKRRMETRVEHA
jgi:hypothetical protein